MSRNASGTYSLPAGNPVVTNEVISSNWANTTLSDVASALTDSLSRSGLGGMTAPLNLTSGAIGAPGLNWSAETTSGLYRAGAGDFRYAIAGSDIFAITSAGFAASVIAPTTLNVSGAATFSRTWTSGNSGAVTLSAAQPLLEVDQSGAAANQRRWWVTATGEELLFQAANDARTSATTFMQVTRTNNTADAINFTSTGLNWNGSALALASTVPSAANPTATIGLSAVNGSAGTFLRSDGAPALSQAIAPTWTQQHIFSKTGGGSDSAIYISAVQPSFSVNESGAAANNRRWDMTTVSEQLRMRVIDDANSVASSWLTVDRTGTTVDRAQFPTDSTGTPFFVGSGSVLGNALSQISTSTASCVAMHVRNVTALFTTLSVINADTAGNNAFMGFATEGGLGTTRGSITYNRAGGLTAYNTTSDENLKSNIEAAGSAIALVKQIPVVQFNWNETGNHVDFGYGAQRTFPLYPRAVTPGYGFVPWQMDYSALVPLLHRALQQVIDYLEL